MRRGFHEPAEKLRRFYKVVETAQAEGGYAVLLDGRALKAPSGRRLLLPNARLAEQVAEEWRAQGDHVELAQMHASRLANTAMDAIPRSRSATAQQVADYAGSDLLCYFDLPGALADLQAARWEPILRRFEREEGVEFVRCAGVQHRPQPAATLERIRSVALQSDDFTLAGLAYGAPLFGSAVLAIALRRGWLSGEAAFDLSRVDEAWQEQRWGIDAEAAERTERLIGEARMLERWFAALPAA